MIFVQVRTFIFLKNPKNKLLVWKYLCDINLQQEIQFYWMQEKQFVDIGKQTVNKYIKSWLFSSSSFYGSNNDTLNEWNLKIL